MKRLNGILLLAIATFLIAAPIVANDTTLYHSEGDKSKEQALGYLKTSQSLARYLAYRDIPFFIDAYANGKFALDYGAGTGFSTIFLQKLGLDCVGADISEEMLMQARSNCPEIAFHLIDAGFIPLESKTFDIIFSSLVLFELGNESEVLAYLNEAKRLMKDDAVFIAVTGSQDMYSKDWLIFDADFPENKNLKSGELAKVYLRDADIVFTDFYWTEADYIAYFKKAGLDLIAIHYPMGQDSESFAWKAERTASPFVILIAKKSCFKK